MSIMPSSLDPPDRTDDEDLFFSDHDERSYVVFPSNTPGRPYQPKHFTFSFGLRELRDGSGFRVIFDHLAEAESRRVIARGGTNSELLLSFHFGRDGSMHFDRTPYDFATAEMLGILWCLRLVHRFLTGQWVISYRHLFGYDVFRMETSRADRQHLGLPSSVLKPLSEWFADPQMYSGGFLAHHPIVPERGQRVRS